MRRFHCPNTEVLSGMMRHERALANIAERNGGTRASGTPGFLKSRDYVVSALQNAGYAVTAVIIFNEDQEGRTDSQGGTLGGPKDVPVLFTSFAVGDELAQAGTVTLHVKTDTINETRETYNVLADSKKGDTSRTLVVGSHLDSVLEGPGINDNGSGTAQDLEIAEELPKALKKPTNHIRFAFLRRPHQPEPPGVRRVLRRGGRRRGQARPAPDGSDRQRAPDARQAGTDEHAVRRPGGGALTQT